LRGSMHSRQTKVFCRHSSIEAAANYNFEVPPTHPEEGSG
jgi:hypothetical protein